MEPIGQHVACRTYSTNHVDLDRFIDHFVDYRDTHRHLLRNTPVFHPRLYFYLLWIYRSGDAWFLSRLNRRLVYLQYNRVFPTRAEFQFFPYATGELGKNGRYA